MAVAVIGLVGAILAFVVLVLFGSFVAATFIKGVGDYERELWRRDRDR